jgi:hypothetical protein
MTTVSDIPVEISVKIKQDNIEQFLQLLEHQIDHATLHFGCDTAFERRKQHSMGTSLTLARDGKLSIEPIGAYENVSLHIDYIEHKQVIDPFIVID